MPSVCDILKKHEDRFASIEAKLTGIGLFDNMGDAKLVGSQWEVGGDMIAVWSAATVRPLSWSQGQWVRLKAGKIEARGDAFTFKSSDTGARIELDGTELAGYDSGNTKQFYLSAADGKGYFAGGKAILGADGIVLSDQLDILWDITTVADELVAGINIEIESDPTENSLTNIFGIKTMPTIKSGNTYDHDLLEGAYFTPRHHGTGDLTTLIGSYHSPRNTSIGTVADMTSVFAYGMNQNAGGTITNYYAFRSITLNSGTITNAYGLFLDDLLGTNSYGIWQDGVNDLNVLRGDLKLKGHLFDHTGLANGKIWMYNNVTGNWELADQATPAPHAASHQDGGGDEIDLTGMSGDEIRLIPKASSAGAEGTLFYCSTDDYVYVATE